jgi:hypothetical protein
MGLRVVVALSVVVSMVPGAWAVQATGALDVPILVTQIPPAATAARSTGTEPRSMALPGDGGRIVLVNPDGTQRVLTEGFCSAADPAVSFDGKRFSFAAKRAPEDVWNVYEYSLETVNCAR